jgi:hypothetical protein
VTITRSDLLAEAAAHYDTGIMDFDRVEACRAEVLIAPMTEVEIEKALDARTKVWERLLQGESQRWSSIEDLRDLYRTAANNSVSAEPLRTLWNGRTPEYVYEIVAAAR